MSIQCVNHCGPLGQWRKNDHNPTEIIKSHIELAHTRHETTKGAERSKKSGEERNMDVDFLRFVLEELEAMQQQVGGLRSAIAAMTTLIKDKLGQPARPAARRAFWLCASL